MIGKITGVIDYVSTDHILIDVAGIGYVIFVTGTTLNKIPAVGERISLFTELVVREDLLQLIGFVTPIERDWYKLLTSVQGVGSKAALALLGHITLKNLSRAILLEDSETIRAAQGIGPKIAKRLVLELKGKVPSMLTQAGKSTSISASGQTSLKSEDLGTPPVLTEDHIIQPEIDEFGQTELDAISGLVNLGYSQIEAAKAVAEILNQTNSSIKVEELIKFALKLLATKG